MKRIIQPLNKITFGLRLKIKIIITQNQNKKHMMEFYNQIENTVLLHSFTLETRKEKQNREDPFREKNLLNYKS